MNNFENPPEIQHLLSVIILQNQRIYDVLLSLLGVQNPEASYNLIEVHKQLENIGPVPYKTSEEFE